jgi:hypothetical protein
MNAISAQRISHAHATVQPLAADGEPPLAAHLTTPRGLYTHHGLYVGQGRVIHYAGLARGLRPGPVEEVSLEQFARGRGIWIDSRRPARFDPAHAITRARTRLGEDRYRVLSNNCEHFCEWCLHGQSRSQQVESWRAAPRAALRTLSTVLRALVTRRAEVGPKRDRFMTTRDAALPKLATP